MDCSGQDAATATEQARRLAIPIFAGVMALLSVVLTVLVTRLERVQIYWKNREERIMVSEVRRAK